jgi:decaprenylphospho-beta-D-ribofuranose 2-oxidase
MLFCARKVNTVKPTEGKHGESERTGPMTILGTRADLTNWTRTQVSSCHVFKARDAAGIAEALAVARARGLSVIAHGAGHSYTDAALNTDGVIIDVTGMRRILSWDPEQGIVHVEPGVTLRDVVRLTLPDGWWPAVTPSTAEATIGGCVAMNVNGKNAWKRGSFGEHVRSLTVLLASGDALTLTPESHPELFRAFVGSAGLLGMIIAIELQLQRVSAASLDLRVRPAASFRDILAILREEQSADFLEAWVDGFAGGRHIGRGLVTCATFCAGGVGARREPPVSRAPDRLMRGVARCAGVIGRPVVTSGARVANRLAYWWGVSRGGRGREVVMRRSLFRGIYYSPAVLAATRVLLPDGIETFQAFVPASQAEGLFKEIVRRSHESACMPLWCVVKQHRADPFLLSYQVDGFSLEVNYRITPRTVRLLHDMLRELMELVIEAGGRFYLAKDSLLTSVLYRQSVGDGAVDTFLQLKQRYDPDMLFQSDLFRRVLRPSAQ